MSATDHTHTQAALEALLAAAARPAIVAAGDEVLSVSPSLREVVGADESGVTEGALLSSFLQCGLSEDTAAARLLTRGGPIDFALEKMPCRWGGREATLYLLQPEAGAGSDGSDEAGPRATALINYLHEAIEQVEVVNRVVAAVNSSRDLDEVFDLASRHMRSLVPFDRASVALCEPDGAHVRVFALSGGERAGSLAIGATGALRGSVTEAALAAGEIVVINELSRESRFNVYEDLLREGFRSSVCCPLYADGRPVGSVNLTSRTPDAYGREHLLALERLAAPLAIAIDKMLLLEEARRRNEELGGLLEISRAFTTLESTSEIGGRLARSIAELTGGTMCLIATYDRARNLVRGEAPGYNVPPEMVSEFRFRLEGAGDSSVYLSGEPFFSNEPARDARLNYQFVRRYGVESVLCAPMLFKGELAGFVYVANRPGGFAERDLRLLEIFAAQAAETIVNAHLFATVQAQAEREALVNRLLTTLQEGAGPREKIDAVIERVGLALGLDRCVAVLYADGEHEDYYGEWCAEGVPELTNWREMLGRSPLRESLSANKRPLAVDNLAIHPLVAASQDLLEQTGVRSLAVVPIMHRGRVTGYIGGHQTRRRRRWAEDDIDLLTAVAAHAGSTLENARLIEELREANRLKDEFLATLSHELRTPLTAITGWVDLLQETHQVAARGAGDDAELADGIDAISVAADSLAQLISDLLDLSRIQRGVLRFDRETLDVNLSVREAARAVRQAALAKRLDLRLELDESLPLTTGDAQRVRQVLWNLLANAIKFTPEGGGITLRTRAEDRATGDAQADAADTAPHRHIVVEIEDTGEGITPAFLPHVFERFRQGDGSATRRHGGLGIGLALVKELVEAHGGTVAAESDGRGARFVVRLPMQWVAAPRGKRDGDPTLQNLWPGDSEE